MLSVLEKFKSDVNANAQIQRIVKGWNTGILLEEKDTSRSYLLDVKEGKIDGIHQFERNSEPAYQTKIAGDQVIMQGLFEGKVNAIRANNDVADLTNDGIAIDVRRPLTGGQPEV